MSPNSVRKVLFIEENRAYFEMLRKVFTPWSGDTWQYFHALNPGKALQILEAHVIDLVVLDQRLTTLDGFQFIKLLRQRYPGARKAVLTAEPNEDKKVLFIGAGVDAYLEKPASIDGMESVFTTLNELARWRSEAGFRGMLHGVRIHTVLQMLCFGHSSAVVEVASGTTRGKVYIQEGFVLHAEAAPHTGELALGLLLNLETGSFELSPLTGSPPELTLSLGWNALDGLPVPAPAAEQVALVEPEVEVPETSAGEPHTDEADSNPIAPEIQEMLVCSGRGDVLFDSGCGDSESRVAFVTAIARGSSELNQIIPMGAFDRVEIEMPEARALIRTEADNVVFVAVRRSKEGVQ